MKHAIVTHIPRLPNPLTPETIGEILKAQPYWDPSHPESKIYQNIVRRGFEIMYPGSTRFDAIGKRIDPKPLKPQYITHLVDAANREIEEIERQFIEQDATGGTVHVRAHTRVVDGKVVEVSAYEREAPGEGSDDKTESIPESRRMPEPPRGENMPYYPGKDRTKPQPLGPARTDEDPRAGTQLMNDQNKNDGLPKPRNLLDEAENAGDAQAGTDDGRPKSGSPVPNPEMRNDLEGLSGFGAKRVHGWHKGIDIRAEPGDEVVSPVDGTIKKIAPAYSDPKYEGLQAITIEGDDNREYKFLYVAPTDGEGNLLIKDGDAVKAGDPIGTAQDRASYDRTGKMENHIHIEIRDESKKIVDPTPDFERWRNESKQSDSPEPTDNQSSPESH